MLNRRFKNAEGRAAAPFSSRSAPVLSWMSAFELILQGSGPFRGLDSFEIKDAA
jgi:hypothetical protein